MRKAARTGYRLCEEAKSIYSTARICKMTSAEISERVEAWRATFPKRLTVNEHGFVSGFIHALNDAIWQEVEFCYRDGAGVIYSTHKASTHRLTEEFYASGRGCELADMESAFLWKGSDKPYTKWSKTADLKKSAST